MTRRGMGQGCTGCGSCYCGRWSGRWVGGGGYADDPRRPAINDPITLHNTKMSPCVRTATASEIQAVIQAATTPTAVLCLGQAVASQPIEAAAVGGTIEYCALIEV